MPNVMKFDVDETAKQPVPADVKALVEAAKKKIAAGEVNTLAPVK